MKRIALVHAASDVISDALFLLAAQPMAKWEGDTFVVSTEGFNDKSWMDSAGLGHGEMLRTTEKLRRRDFGHLDVELTVDDSQWFTRSWSIDFPFVLQADTELDENICDNERDAAHLVGK